MYCTMHLGYKALYLIDVQSDIRKGNTELRVLITLTISRHKPAACLGSIISSHPLGLLAEKMVNNNPTKSSQKCAVLTYLSKNT